WSVIRTCLKGIALLAGARKADVAQDTPRHAGLGAYSLLLALDLKLLDAAAPIGFRHVDAAFGIHCKRMAVSEIADLMSWPSEARQDLAGGMIEYVHLLGATIHHVHEPLRRIRRERNPPRRPALVR